jgi:hypothetical protein
LPAEEFFEDAELLIAFDFMLYFCELSLKFSLDEYSEFAPSSYSLFDIVSVNEIALNECLNSKERVQQHLSI